MLASRPRRIRNKVAFLLRPFMVSWVYYVKEKEEKKLTSGST
jgi:hypothetical protein